MLRAQYAAAVRLAAVAVRRCDRFPELQPRSLFAAALTAACVSPTPQQAQRQPSRRSHTRLLLSAEGDAPPALNLLGTFVQASRRTRRSRTGRATARRRGEQSGSRCSRRSRPPCASALAIPLPSARMPLPPLRRLFPPKLPPSSLSPDCPRRLPLSACTRLYLTALAP